MNDSAMLTALVTGLLAVIGAFLGAWLTRRSEYEKWHRQEKGIATSEYLRQLHATRLNASEAYYGVNDGDELSRSIQATEAFAQLEKFTSVLRLYLSSESRENLSELQKALWIHCTVQGGPANRVEEIKKLMHRIQLLLEAELTRVPNRLRWLL